MVKDKERNVNPAQAQRKLEKQKALKKGKAEVQARRNEKLARRNPERLQRQIDDLKAVEESGQSLRTHDKQVLEGLERDLRAVKKAREALGDRAPTFGRSGGDGDGGDRRHHDRGQPQGVLGKRRREGLDRRRQQEDDGSDTDDSVRKIPMPRDTPPPIPRQHPRKQAVSADRDRPGEEMPSRALPQKPNVSEPKTVYEAAPEIRDLRQEAVNKFVPTAVRTKQAAAKGQGQLVEPEEMDKLEKAGYRQGDQASQSAPSASAAVDHKPPGDSVDTSKLEEEEERFNRELRSVQVEDVTDEEL